MIHLIPWLIVCLVFGVTNFFPLSLPVLFIINIWGLSMPHTFSTFTRNDLRNKKTSAIALLLFTAFFITLNLITMNSGFVIIYSLYFYWQQFHYTKQNMGIGVWDKKEGLMKDRLIDHSFFFLVTIVSILGIFNQGSVQFFGYALLNPFPLSLSAQVASIANFVIFCLYVGLRPSNWQMALTHTLIYSFAFLYIHNFVLGWLLLNVLHNSQYLIFMNKGEKDLRFFFYATILTIAFYFIMDFGVVFATSIALSLNFTHYIFDGIIWKKRFKLSPS